jgi:glycosyltransferase involved in cell wall biosynthesis
MFTDAYWPRVNGVTVSVDTFSRALIRAGHEVLIVCSEYPDTYNLSLSLFPSEKKDDDPLIIRVPSMPVLISKEDRLAKFYKWNWVFKQVEAFNPDIIHTNSEVTIADFGFLYGRMHNIPAIYTFHTMWEEYGPNYFPSYLPLFLVLLFVHTFVKNVIRRSYRVIVPTIQIEAVVKNYKLKKTTYLLPTGIETGLYQHEESDYSRFREQMEIRFPVLKGKQILLFAGRVTKEKNINFLLDILPAIVQKHNEIMLMVVGNGPYLENLQKEADEMGLGENCLFTGYMTREDLSLAYGISRVFVFPSLTDTQGLVTLESMLSGTPVVAIGEMGTIMVMGGDNGGFMVKNDPDEFSARVLNLLEDDELYQRKSQEAKVHAMAWSIGEVTKKLVNIYEHICKSYRNEYGPRRMPVWELLTNKRWWLMYKKILKKKLTPKSGRKRTDIYSTELRSEGSLD